MRVLLVLLLVVAVLFAVGWLRFSADENGAGATIDTAAVRQDTGELMRRADDAINRTVDEVDDAVEQDTRGTPDTLK